MSAAPVTRARLHRPDLRVEKQILRDGCTRLAAMDEVGRGALAGPVTVGVVVVTAGIGRVPMGLRDSKLLTPAARDALVTPVRRWAGEWAVGHASPAEIDRFGIMTGLRMAGLRALAQLSSPVDAVLLDGNHDFLNAPAQTELFEASRVGDERPGGWVGDGGDGSGRDGGEDRGSGVRVGGVADVDAGDGGAVVAPPFVPVHLRIKADLRCAGVAAASVLAKTTRDAMMVERAGEFPAYEWAINKGYATAAHLAALAEHGACEWHRRSWRLSVPHQGLPVGNDRERAIPANAARSRCVQDVKGA
jgi:ribonuclease HII